MTTPQVLSVNRSLIGAIALVLLAAAALLTLAGLDSQGLWTGACLKVGLVMGAFWLALPSMTRNSEFGHASWTALLTVLAVALVIARTRVPLPTVLVALVVIVALLRLLRPRPPRTAPPRRFQ